MRLDDLRARLGSERETGACERDPARRFSVFSCGCRAEESAVDRWRVVAPCDELEHQLPNVIVPGANLQDP